MKRITKKESKDKELYKKRDKKKRSLENLTPSKKENKAKIPTIMPKSK